MPNTFSVSSRSSFFLSARARSSARGKFLTRTQLSPRVVPYAQTILADAPLRYYRDGVLDQGSQGINGTLHGGVTTGSSGLLPQDTHTSTYFDGTGYMTAPDTGLPIGDNPWSLECWCKPSSPVIEQALLSWGIAIGYEWAGVFIHSEPRFATSTQDGLNCNGIFTSADVVYYVVGLYDGAAFHIYVGDTSTGILYTGDTLVEGPLDVTLSGSLYIATDVTLGFPYKGYIQENAYYNYALPLSKIWTHWVAGAFPANGQARARFRTGKHRALKAVKRSEIPHINQKPRSEVQHINATFSEGPMSNPNTTIDASVTITDMNNVVVSNLSAASCVVTFPDGSTSSYTATNQGSGVYVITYTTKGPGLHRELWNFTDQSGAIAQYLNVNAVSF